MRGKPATYNSNQIRMRITPAHAGKTRSAFTSPRLSRDHPRACGENISVLKALGDNRGSPPRMRGKLLAALCHLARVRITPAHAGKTLSYAARRRYNRDHPRACGENSAWLMISFALAGSPPRMRGKHFGNGVFPWLILVLSLDPL